EVTPHARLEVQQAAHPVSAQQAGALRSTALQLGRSVKAGEVLAELDDRAARARLAAEVQVRDAQSRSRLDALQGQLAALDGEAATLSGTCAGVDEDGALLLRTPDGLRRVLSGEVSLRLA
ncbi:MAG: hypothetical protein JNK74_29370, partial [Candidatus Hydrogenedentes bacterium]|nr:hypothetical protein [Candidatus Hydrogenedentota bacterium]